MIKAFVFDLDDTLFPETEYVRSGFRTVAEYFGKTYGVKEAYPKLQRLFAENAKGVFDRLCEEEKLSEGAKKEAIDIYRTHRPENLPYADGAEELLKHLRKNGYRLGIITDGRPFAQQAKIDALGVADLVDEIIITDALGGEEYRKPNPYAFRLMTEKLGVKAEETVYVGDNPQKDFAIKKYLPVTTVRVLGQGLYGNVEYFEGIMPDVIIRSIGEIKEIKDMLSMNKNREEGFEKIVYDEQTKEIFDFIHKKSLELLKEITDVADRTGVKVFPYSGSMLGIIRDGGFIPWDDDIDVLMTRGDFEKFCIEFQKSVSEDKIFSNKGDKLYTLKFKDSVYFGDLELKGIGIDFFILDSLSDKKWKRKLQLFGNKVMQGMLKTKPAWSKYSFKEKILVFGTKTVGCCLTNNAKQKLYKKICDAKEDNSRYYFVSNGGYYFLKLEFERKWFDNGKEIDFFGCRMYLPEEAEKQLEMIFGDWRTPVEGQKRASVHVLARRCEQL